MVRFVENGDTVIFSVRVIPRASKSGIVGEHDGDLKIRLVSPPVDGAANEELIKLLAKSFAVSKSAVIIVAGLTSKTKKVQITGAPGERIGTILQAKN